MYLHVCYLHVHYFIITYDTFTIYVFPTSSYVYHLHACYSQNISQLTIPVYVKIYMLTVYVLTKMFTVYEFTIYMLISSMLTTTD